MMTAKQKASRKSELFDEVWKMKNEYDERNDTDVKWDNIRWWVRNSYINAPEIWALIDEL
jgi:hypothetical protein